MRAPALLLGLLITSAGIAPSAVADELRMAVAIPAQSLATALQQLAKQADLQLVYQTELAAGLQSPEVKGELSVRETLERLLQGTGLRYQFLDERTVAVSQVPMTSSAGGELTRIHLAQAGSPHVDAARSDVAPSERARIEEVIVTAQKREERLQDVPIAISVLTSDYLESRDLTSIDRLSTLAPGFKIEQTNNSTFSILSMRGKSSLGTSLFNEPSVGLYIDGVYIPKAQGSVFDIADLERIEVLRGPQGTLYGRNTLAGAVNLITKAPSGSLGGSIDLSYGNHDYWRARGILNLPQVGVFSAKLSGLIARRDGFVDIVDNPYPDVATAGPRIGDEARSLDSKTAAFQLRAEPNERLTLDYRFDWSVVDQVPPLSQLVGVAPGGIFDPNSPAYDAPFVGGTTFPADLYVASRRRVDRASLDRDTREYAKNTAHALTASLELPGLGELKSISAYRDMRLEDRLDLDGTPLPLAHTQRETDYKAFSQELQLAGDYARGKYTIGVYYFDDDGYTDNPQSYFGGLSNTDSRNGFTTESYAAYGQVDFEITDALTLTGGIRYTKEEKTVERYLQTGPSIRIDAPDGTIPAVDFSKVSPTVVLAYEIAPELNVYAKYSQGYRSGGFNADATTLADVATPFDPETVDAYEIGLKSQFFDRRLQLNIAAFWNEFDDMQLTVFRGETSATSNIINAGQSRIRGLEAEASILPIDGLLLQLSASYIDPSYQEFLDRGINVAGNRAFPHASEYTASASIDWTAWRFAAGTLRVIADASYVSKYFTFPYALVPAPGQNDAHNTESPGRTIIDLQAILGGFKFGDVDAQLALWGRNLLDEDHPSQFVDFGAGFGGLTIASYPTPRTYGLTFTMKF